MRLDSTQNNIHPVETNITTSVSAPILVIQTQDDWAIASYCLINNLVKAKALANVRY